MSDQDKEALNFMLGMSPEELEYWADCGEYTAQNVIDLYREVLRLRKELEDPQGEVERLNKELSDARLMLEFLAEDKRTLVLREKLKDSIIETLTKQKLEEASTSAGAIIERDWYKNELEKVQNTANKSLELSLLEMWHEQGIKEIYKYKNRIKVYKREGLIRYELFTDLTCGLLFKDVEDTANYQDATPEDFKVRVDVLLTNRRGDNE